MVFTRCNRSSRGSDYNYSLIGTSKQREAEPEQSLASTKKRAYESLPSDTVAKRPKLSNHTDDDAQREGNRFHDFLKSRPQIASMNKAQSSRDQKSIATESPTTGQQSANEGEEIVLNTDFEGNQAAWQHHESVVEFLRRLPVAEPATARVGPWLWVGSRTCKQKCKRSGNVEQFLESAAPLLGGFLERRATVEQQNPGKAVGTITRKMGPYRDQLQVDLLNAATRIGLTCGKWMLFPQPDDLPRVWRLVAEATAEGKLGMTSKVGTFQPESVSKGTVICVYTYDFSDLEDVGRVLQSLVDQSILRTGAKVYYKCDAYTYLHINSGNEYRLQASLYSSEDVLQGKVKYADGVISRL